MDDCKLCIRCKEMTSLTEFHKDSKTRDGHKSWCKKCVYEYDTQRSKDPEVRKKRNEQSKARNIRKMKKRYLEHVGYVEKIPEGINLDDVKTCPRCNIGKQLREYYYERSRKDFCYYCKECSKEKDRENRVKREIEKLKTIREIKNA